MDNYVYVYTENGNQYRFEFRMRDQMKQIKILQIWNDLEYLESLEFKYKINNS